MEARGLVGCFSQVVTFASQIFEFCPLCLPFPSWDGVKYNFAQVQHKSRRRHLLFFEHMHNFVQPVLLLVTFGLHLHFDSSLSALSCSLNPCQFLSWPKVLHFYKSWQVFTHARATACFSNLMCCGQSSDVRTWVNYDPHLVIITKQ